MAQLVIGGLEDAVWDRLQDLARDHRRSVEEEVRSILRLAVEDLPSNEADLGLGTRLARRFAGIGLDEEIPELRGWQIKPPSFDP